jgi:hypothetical protein
MGFTPFVGRQSAAVFAFVIVIVIVAGSAAAVLLNLCFDVGMFGPCPNMHDPAAWVLNARGQYSGGSDTRGQSRIRFTLCRRPS